jgi:hypothetical protein
MENTLLDSPTKAIDGKGELGRKYLRTVLHQSVQYFSCYLCEFGQKVITNRSIYYLDNVFLVSVTNTLFYLHFQENEWSI